MKGKTVILTIVLKKSFLYHQCFAVTDELVESSALIINVCRLFPFLSMVIYWRKSCFSVPAVKTADHQH